jgi:hypothetical protein
MTNLRNKTEKGNTAGKKKFNNSFFSKKLTSYSGLSVAAEFCENTHFFKKLPSILKVSPSNALKFDKLKVVKANLFAALCGVNRAANISKFTADPLVSKILEIHKPVNPNALRKRLDDICSDNEQANLRNLILEHNSLFLKKSGLSQITLDVDSTVFTAYGNQEEAQKGYNPQKAGAKGYHPLLAFVSELQMLYHTEFRPGNAHTASGTLEMLSKIRESLPKNVKNVLFRADSGFFDGKIFDLLEQEDWQWNYLVKVKFRNIDDFYAKCVWKEHSATVSTASFSHKPNAWKKARVFKVIRTQIGTEKQSFMGTELEVPKYVYACYVSSYENKDALELHELYTQRAVCETWIEQIKSQLKAGKTLTESYEVNALLWQLSCFAYNLSKQFRASTVKIYKEEHRSFLDWFIKVPGIVCTEESEILIISAKDYLYRERWERFAQRHKAA